MSDADRRHSVSLAPCPALRATYRGYELPIDVRARVRDLEAPDVKLRCHLRPGVALAADYVVDLCLGRAYGDYACLFAAQAQDERSPRRTLVSDASALI